MRKLELDLDMLSVESFTTEELTDLRGTVQGASYTKTSGICSHNNMCFPTDPPAVEPAM